MTETVSTTTTGPTVPASSGSPTPEQVRQLFNPRSIALIGATDKSRWSWSTYGNLKLHEFDGPVYLVNPRGIPVHGEQTYAKVGDLPERVDLAFVMVPTTAILSVLEEVADAGIPSAVVLTSGFGEVGEAGAALERQVVELARRRGLTILGPNGNGYINAAANIMPYGLVIEKPLLRGPVGVVLQSGALASAVLSFATTRNIGTSLLVSMGNESMLSMTDVMRYLIDDDATKVIALFIESVRKPAEFLALAREALAKGKPIVAIKVGRSQAGARVARAHTGSLVGDDAVVDAVFRQNGVIRVDSLEDLVITAGLLTRGPLPGKRFGFVTASGGASEIIADRSEDEGIEIPEFAPETVERLRAVIPDFGAAQNPVDVTGYILINRDLLRNALLAVQDDPGLDALVLVTDLPRSAPPGDAAPVIEMYRQTVELLNNSTKPVVVMGTTLTDITAFGRDVANQTGYPNVLGGIDHGLVALGRAVRWSEQYRAAQAAGQRTADQGGPLTVAKPVPELVVPEEPGGSWTEHRAAAFLAQHGVPVVPSTLATSAEAAVEAANAAGYPVVVKLAADGIEHKSDIGGVKIGLDNADAVAAAYADVVSAGQQAGAEVQGALVQPMRSGGIELLVGIVTDPAWGQVLAVGFGGIWVEILRDAALSVLPVNRDQVLASLRSLRGAALFEGPRGTEKADLDAVADAIVAVAELAQRLGDRLEALEINPLLVKGSQVEALDALITWRP